MKAIFAILMMGVSAPSQSSEMWRVAQTSVALFQALGSGLAIYYCDPQLSWGKFVFSVSSILGTNLSLPLPQMYAVSKYLGNEQDTGFYHRFDVLFKQNIFSRLLKNGTLSLYAGYQLYNFGENANPKTMFFLGSLALLGMSDVIYSTIMMAKDDSSFDF